MRRGRVIGGIVVMLAAAALSAPYAFGASGSAVDQGYPCATTPPPAGSSGGGAGQCASGSTKPVSHVAGVSHTAQRPVAAAVAPAATHTGGTLPFTGLQLTMFVVIGVLLIGGGLILRASGRRGSGS